MLFLASAASAAVTVYITYKVMLLFIYPNFEGAYRAVRAVYARIPEETVFFALWAVFFLFYFIVFSHSTVHYIARMMTTVQHMSQGRFDLAISEKRTDAFGDLARTINQMSRQLEASLEEERMAVQTKNELITNVSHDLRTPLTSVIGYLRLIEEDRYKDEVELRYYVNIAYEKSLRLGRMVNDLFEYTRMSHGDFKLQLADINLVELLGQLTAEFSLTLREEKMELQLHLTDESMIISADGDKLMRVFENLMANAMKYGRQGKWIDIELKRERSVAVVRVINYGPPIPSTDLPHIFDRFYRVEKSRSDETGGTGLGLAIAKNIIEKHGGTIGTKSDSKETVFEVRLPLKSVSSR